MRGLIRPILFLANLIIVNRQDHRLACTIRCRRRTQPVIQYYSKKGYAQQHMGVGLRESIIASSGGTVLASLVVITHTIEYTLVVFRSFDEGRA